MQGLTIQRPWANLLAKGIKKYETRNWMRKYNGLIAIHAGKQIALPSEYRELFEHLDLDESFNEFIQQSKQKIIAVGYLKKYHPMTPEFINSQTEIERMAGYWEPGNYAWEITDIEELPEPIPFRGMPGLFEIPESVKVEIFNQIKVFKCPRCRKIVPWSQGVDDDQPSLCDDCWEHNRKGMEWAKERMNAIQAKWGGSLIE